MYIRVRYTSGSNEIIFAPEVESMKKLRQEMGSNDSVLIGSVIVRLDKVESISEMQDEWHTKISAGPRSLT